jgi:hypothetical protein
VLVRHALAGDHDAALLAAALLGDADDLGDARVCARAAEHRATLAARHPGLAGLTAPPPLPDLLAANDDAGGVRAVAEAEGA